MPGRNQFAHTSNTRETNKGFPLVRRDVISLGIGRFWFLQRYSASVNKTEFSRKISNMNLESPHAHMLSSCTHICDNAYTCITHRYIYK